MTTTECVYHEIEDRAGKFGTAERYAVTVFRGGECVDVDMETGEATFSGGVAVATVYRRTIGEAHRAGIDFSFRCC